MRRRGSRTRIRPPEARHGVAGANQALETPPDLDQQTIADLVTQRVVRHLEVVDVEEQHRDGALSPARLGEKLVQTVEEERAVRKPGQGIVECEERQTVLRPCPLDCEAHQMRGDLGDPLRLRRRRPASGGAQLDRAQHLLVLGPDDGHRPMRPVDDDLTAVCCSRREVGAVGDRAPRRLRRSVGIC